MSSPTSGYSGTPLPKKLGIRAGSRVLLINAPADYRSLLTPLPDGVEFITVAESPLLFVHLFVVNASDLGDHLTALYPLLAPDGVIWVSWPKKASGVKTDMTENAVRAAAFPLGLVDIKVCAVDATWSGLKLVIRVVNRPKKTIK